MKTKIRAVIWLLIPLVAQGAISETPADFLFRNRNPIANDSLRCDLMPLYSWWVEELEAAKNAQSVAYTNSVVYQPNLTNRPMAPWVHVTGAIIKEIPQGWVVNGSVEYTPGKGNPMQILLIHPPRKELERFIVKSNLMNNPLPTPDYSAQEQEIELIKSRALVADTYGYYDLEDTYLAVADRAKSDLQLQKDHDQSLLTERNRVLDDLGNFPPDWQTYRADVFALNTGRQLYGLPVFDAGLSFAK